MFVLFLYMYLFIFVISYKTMTLFESYFIYFSSFENGLSDEEIIIFQIILTCIKQIIS